MILSSTLNIKLKTLKVNVKSKNKKSKNFVCHAIKVSKIYFLNCNQQELLDIISGKEP